MVDTSNDSTAFSNALETARNADTRNGWAVSPQTPDVLTNNNVHTIMASDGMAGLGVAPDGDIEAVFKNPNGSKKGALNTLIPAALEAGGNKLDCYGIELVVLYSRYGFVPVAKVDFNSEFANPGWSPDKGEPPVYFMMHNGDSPDVVARNIGKYPKPTQAELDALPHYDKNGYEDAYAYRDNLIYKIENAPADIKTGVTAESGITGTAEGVSEGLPSKGIISPDIPNVNTGNGATTEINNCKKLHLRYETDQEGS